jgi:hypothetical protein
MPARWAFKTAEVPMTDETAVTAESQPAAPEQPNVAEATQAPAREPEVTAAGEEETRTQRNWKALREDRDHWRDVAREVLSRQTPPAPPEPKAEPAKAKSLADFNYDESQYQGYLEERLTSSAREAVTRELKAERDRQESERRWTSFTTRESDFATSVSDYHEVTRNPRLPITEDIAEVIAESDDGPALAYYLGKNLAVADQIARLPPKLAARELGRIEARLAFERDKAKEAPAVSKAPPPPPKLEGVEAEVEKDPDKMTGEDWLKWRNKQLRNKRK